MSMVEKTIKDEGQTLVGWRDVPVDSKKANVGDTARDSQPDIKQLIIQNTGNLNQESFEGVLYVIRKKYFLRLLELMSLSHKRYFSIFAVYRQE